MAEPSIARDARPLAALAPLASDEWRPTQRRDDWTNRRGDWGFFIGLLLWATRNSHD